MILVGWLKQVKPAISRGLYLFAEREGLSSLHSDIVRYPMEIKCRASPFSFFIAVAPEHKMLFTSSKKNAPAGHQFFYAEREGFEPPDL